MRQKSRSEKGQGIIEVLIATLLITVSAVGLGYSIIKMGQSRKKLEAVSQAVSIESGIVARLSDPETFASLSSSLRSGVAGAIPTIAVKVPAKIGGKIVDITFNTETRQFFKIDGSSCTGFSDKECLYSVLIKGQNMNTGSAFQSYAYGYRVEINPSFANVAPFGAKIASGGSADIPAGQFQVSVPYDAYRDTSLQTCDPASDVLITGMNRETGQLYCLKKPDPAATACDPAQGKLMKGLKVVNRPGVGYVIEPECMQLRKIECTDTRYSLQSVVPSDFISSNPLGTSNTCVYKGADSETFTFVTSASNTRHWKGTLCPTDYEPTGVTCTSSLIDHQEGQYDACPSGYHGNIQNCGYGTENTVSSNLDAATKVFECKVTPTSTQLCPTRPVASSFKWWDGALTITGTCKLKAGLSTMSAVSKSY